MQFFELTENIRAAGAATALLLVVSSLLFTVGVTTIERATRTLAAFMLRRDLFRTPLEQDLIKLNLLRIAAGLLLVHRTANIAAFVLTGPDGMSAKAACVAALLLGMAFTAGFATPLVSTLLLFGNILVFDSSMNTYALSSNVLAMTLLVFAFAPAGTRLSIDAALLHRGIGGPFHKFVHGIYRFYGAPNTQRIAVAKTMCFLSYGLLCLYSIAMHLKEPMWLSGEVGFQILSSTYLSRYPDTFDALMAQSPMAFQLLRLAMGAMLIWYVTLMPFTLLGGWFRKIALTWTLLFLAVSAFLLQLGWAAYHEVVLFLLLFWSRSFMGTRGRSRLDILYDDRCNLCDRTVRFLRLVDVFSVLRLRPLSANTALAESLGLGRLQALADIHGFDPRTGTLHVGFALYRAISARLVLLAWLYPLARLAEITRAGPGVYAIIARRRIQLFGVCETPADVSVPPPLPPQPRAARWPRALFAAFASLYASAAALFVATLPGSPMGPPTRFWEYMDHAYALMQINVFNATDIRLSENWFTVEAVDDAGAATLVPYTAPSGARLAWHRSDRVFFAHSLRWRRGVLNRSPVCAPDQDRAYFNDLFHWTNARMPDQATGGFRVVYYFRKLPTVSFATSDLSVSKPLILCTVRFDERGDITSVMHTAESAIVGKLSKDLEDPRGRRQDTRVGLPPSAEPVARPILQSI